MRAGLDAKDVRGIEAKEGVEAHGEARIACRPLRRELVVHVDHRVAVDAVEHERVHPVGFRRIQLEHAGVLDRPAREVAAVLA